VFSSHSHHLVRKPAHRYSRPHPLIHIRPVSKVMIIPPVPYFIRLYLILDADKRSRVDYLHGNILKRGSVHRASQPHHRSEQSESTPNSGALCRPHEPNSRQDAAVLFLCGARGVEWNALRASPKNERFQVHSHSNTDANVKLMSIHSPKSK
jgi:hypothetical protein